MSYVQLPDELKAIVAQHVAEGHAASEAEFLADAVRLYADHLQAEQDIAALVERADSDVAAGRYVTISTPEDGEALHHRIVERLWASMAKDGTPG